MKKYFILAALCLLAITQYSHAFIADCGFDQQFYQFFLTEGNHRIVVSNLDLDCDIKSKGITERMHFNLETFGPGLELTAASGIVISCPFVSLNRLNNVLDKKGSWSAVGVGASASALIGLRAGVSVNHRGAICSLIGFNGGFGASAGAIKISVKK